MRALNLAIRSIGWAYLVALTGGYSATAAGIEQTPPPSSPNATQIQATGEVDVGVPVSVSLRANADRIWLRLEAAGMSEDLPLSLAGAINMLADRRYAFLWTPLLQWAGDDLRRLREATVDWTRAAIYQVDRAMAPRTTGESVVSRQLLAIIQHADALSTAGRFDEALTLLRAQLPRRLRRNRDQQNFAIINSIIASTLRRAGRSTETVLASYEQARSQLGNSPFGLNLDVNRAALLANSGRYAEALRIIDIAFASFRAGRHQIPGSERQFAWIRACALHGLGQQEEARALAQALETGAEPQSQHWVLEFTVSIKMRLHLCMRDTQATVNELIRIARAADTAGFAGLAQANFDPPGYPQEVLAAIRANPELQTMFAERYRQLPDGVLQALRDVSGPARH